MWQHDCPMNGKIEVGDNEPCNWCDAVEQMAETLEAASEPAGTPLSGLPSSTRKQPA